MSPVTAPGTVSPRPSPMGTGHPEFVRRINVRFSGRGRYASCLAGRGPHLLAPELWDLTGGTPRPRILPTHDGESPWTTPLPTDDGRLLLLRHLDGGIHQLVVAVPGPDADGDGGVEEHRLAAVRGGELTLAAGPARGTAAVAFRTGADQVTAVWRLSGHLEPPEVAAEVPGPVTGRIWLDETGDRLALTGRGPEAATMVLDLARGTVTPLRGPAAGEHLLAAAPRTGVLLTVATRDGAHRLGVRHRDDEGPTVFPARLNAIEGTVAPLALDPAGRRLALSVTRGTRCHLLVHDLADDTITEIDLAAGVLYPVARWNATGLHLVHSTPDHPLGVITLAGPVRPGVPLAPGRSPAGWAPARAHTFDGPAGDIEAVVYGDPATSPQVVLALHGGPDAAWQLGFDPLFQRLAAAGIAVVAPNQRGSTGYGTAHRDAIRGAWGGPDLDDVLHLGRTLTATRGPGRERPALYGVSYGAHLALLAAAAQAGLWSRAAVVAPFLSGPALYADGPQSVRNLIDRLGGCAAIDDELGPRDLLRLAPRMRLPLLVVHGEQDLIIPVAHSRRLRDRLRASGHRDGVDLTYLEAPGGHDPLSEDGGHLVLDRVVAFLHTGPPAPPEPR
ncbi:dipeptidyl aminopeptidase/acylaminoacyl peptidase [Streptosporangium becharense]|uniref:Dipeptidyl aminopeptidase/acylaminoacyl peptidase n=1 Tax=Streptosporangium becharense TaxID=1816182 RepID=A0A7W9IK98_9ACTN|nr:prolyl oligopeptidase family serine peptidase [Streptosporangium becharense]MBB2913306.1 dipeptidyl aminopeptidase/acylaminoacyl peptidase [Streptosporangium becharense]MBB5822289.1 dipeptidyl aminopeptidase/acylaminoacyl peptidase [Streptosporangium becharense]